MNIECNQQTNNDEEFDFILPSFVYVHDYSILVHEYVIG